MLSREDKRLTISNCILLGHNNLMGILFELCKRTVLKCLVRAENMGCCLFMRAAVFL